MKAGNSKVQSDRTIETRLSFAAAVVVGLVIFGVGLVLILGQPHDWTAKSTAVVLPKADVPEDSAPSYYDTLSQGQIVETYAEVLRLQRFKNESVQALKLGVAGESAQVTVSVVPNTALLSVTASGPDAQTAEKLADTVLERARTYVNGLSGAGRAPYTIQRVSSAAGTGTQPPSNSVTLLAALFVVSLVIAFATYQGVSQLLLLRQRRRDSESNNGNGVARPARRKPTQSQSSGRRSPEWPRLPEQERQRG
jgi:capsular polysaccharide biosynthesis protein